MSHGPLYIDLYYAGKEGGREENRVIEIEAV